VARRKSDAPGRSAEVARAVVGICREWPAVAPRALVLLSGCEVEALLSSSQAESGFAALIFMLDQPVPALAADAAARRVNGSAG
jgi:hypothetical protein